VEVIKTEKIDEKTGISVDKNRNSLGYCDIVIMSARNLPEMNKISHSADPYVELLLSGGENHEKNGKKSGKMDRNVTSVQRNNLFPVWREYFKLLPIENLNQSINILIKNASKSGKDVYICSYMLYICIHT
jgi:Ca2+-dependent lipid-binding protein